MATTQETVDYILDQLSSLSELRTRKMFGEYALYSHDKVVALICDDTLFVKITEEGVAFAGTRYKEGLPYPGAKPWMEINHDDLEDHVWLSALVAITEEYAPLPKPKKKPRVSSNQ